MIDYLDRPIDDVPPGWAEVYDETSFWAARFGALLFDCLELKPVRDGEGRRRVVDAFRRAILRPHHLEPRHQQLRKPR